MKAWGRHILDPASINVRSTLQGRRLKLADTPMFEELCINIYYKDMIERYVSFAFHFSRFKFNTVLQPTVGPIFSLIHWQRKTTMLLSWGLGWNHQSTYLHVLKANVTRLMRRELGVYHLAACWKVLNSTLGLKQCRLFCLPGTMGIITNGHGPSCIPANKTDLVSFSGWSTLSS